MILRRERRETALHHSSLSLRVHPAPGAHIFTVFVGVHTVCAHFLSYLSLLHIRRLHGEIPGSKVL